MNILRRLKEVFDKKDFYFFILLLFYTIFVSAVEVIGISAIVPFIAIVNDFTIIERNRYINYFYRLFGCDSYISFTMILAIVLLCYYLMRCLLNIYYNYLIARFSFGRYKKITEKLFKSFLFSHYSRFIGIDSATINRAITAEALNLSQFLQSSLILLSELIIICLLYTILIIVNLEITLILTVLFIVIFVILVKVISLQIKQAGINRSINQKEVFNITGEAFGNFKFIKLTGVENSFVTKFINAIKTITTAYIKQQTMSNLPRLILETVGFCILIIFVAYYIYVDKSNINKFIPTISIFIMALYRMLPSYNRILTNYNILVFNINSVYIVSKELRGEIEYVGNEFIYFNNSIELKNVSFYYNPDNFILKNVNLKIAKCSKIGIVGESGIGKSTLLDIIMGFLLVKEGSVLIDSTPLSIKNVGSWRRKIGYVPQNVYLFNDTIEKNILFGRDLDEEQLATVLKQANINRFLEKVKGTVGEGGINLSGGEKQRVAIARALYGKPEVLIMDEATSALDLETEANIVTELFDNCPDLTIIIVSHRLSTIERCDICYEMKNGSLIKVD